MRTARAGRETESYGASNGVQLDDSASCSNGGGGGFEDSDDSQSCVAVRHGRLAGFDALDEVSGFGAERFGDVELRRAHIARSVVDEHPVLAAVSVAVDGDTLVVDLDLLARLEIVVHDHFAAATNERAAHLHGREPVHMQVRDETVLEEERQVGDVLR